MATKSSKLKGSTKAPSSEKSPKPTKINPIKENAKAPTRSSAKKATLKEVVKAVEPPATPLRKKRVVKSTPSKTASGITLDPKPPVIEPLIPHEEISLRAYYIGERRQKMGWHGNPATDWADALSQLRTEALENPLKKR